MTWGLVGGVTGDRDEQNPDIEAEQGSRERRMNVRTI